MNFPFFSSLRYVSRVDILHLDRSVRYDKKFQFAHTFNLYRYKKVFVFFNQSLQIFDATHSEGKSNALLFKLGTGSVIPGLDIMVANMKVGQKVQAIIPPSLAYGEKGVCLEDGECLIKPGSTLVYDIFLKKSSIPPP